MNIKQRLLNRSRGKEVEFLGDFSELNFSANGTAKYVASVHDLPLDTVLLVPIQEDDTIDYVNAIAAQVKCVGNKLTIDPESWEALKLIPGATQKALISVPRRYFSRSIDQLLPAEIRKLTSSSSDVMKRIAERDPKLIDRLTEVISDKVQGGTASESEMNRAIEAAMNVELAIKYPDIMLEINEAQSSQPALQAAILIGASQDFMKIIQLRIPDGDSWIADLLQEISPVTTPEDVKKDEDAVVDVAATPIKSAIEAALEDEIDEEEDDESTVDEADVEYEDDDEEEEADDDEEDDDEDDEDDED